MAEASDERPAPSATGTLAIRPVVHLLVYARNRRLSGKLEVHAPDGRSGTLDLWRGRIRGVRTFPAVAYFGAVAYELGHIDTQELDATLLEISKTKRLHGEVLVERGSLSAALRDQVLTEQTCRKVHHLFTLPPEAAFAFYEARASTDEPPFTLDPIMPAWRGLRDAPPTESAREVLARYASATLRISNEGPLAFAGLDADETALCEALLWKPMTLSELRAVSRLPNERLESLVYLLVITKCAEPEAASSPRLPASSASSASSASMRAAPPASPAGPVAGPHPSQPSTRAIPVAAPSSRPSMTGMARTTLRPSGTTPAADTTAPGTRAPAAPAMRPSGSAEIRHSLSFRVPSAPRMATASDSSSRTPIAAHVTRVFSPSDLGAVGIEHRASLIQSEDPFTALGLPEGATVDAARAAYFRLAKVWHPDRLAGDLAPFRVEAEKIFDHMTRAHRTLTDPDARRDFLATGNTGGSAGVAAEARPREALLREIEQALAKRDFRTAEATARHLSSTDDDDAEALALVAWASTFGGEASEETLREAVPLLDRAVNRDCDCERALYYRACLYKRLGSSAQAFRDFSRVAALNPRHVDAQREIRIFEMRSRKGSGEHALDRLVAKAKKK